MTNRVSRFRQSYNGPTYRCLNCGKLTRETGDCESGAEMCRSCYLIAGTENQHTDDNHPGRFADCAECKANVEADGITHPTADSWCDNPPPPSAPLKLGSTMLTLDINPDTGCVDFTEED